MNICRKTPFKPLRFIAIVDPWSRGSRQNMRPVSEQTQRGARWGAVSELWTSFELPCLFQSFTFGFIEKLCVGVSSRTVASVHFHCFLKKLASHQVRLHDFYKPVHTANLSLINWHVSTASTMHPTVFQRRHDVRMQVLSVTPSRRLLSFFSTFHNPCAQQRRPHLFAVGDTRGKSDGCFQEHSDIAAPQCWAYLGDVLGPSG